MDALDVIKKRKSTRAFIDKEVPYELLINILDAGNAAPSAGNVQDWKFILVYEEATKKALATLSNDQEWMAWAGAQIVVCSVPELTTEFYGERGGMVYTLQNASAAMENMLLAATAQGLGSCWVGAFDEDEVHKLLKIPEEARALGIICVGYTDEEHDKTSPPKKKLNEVLCFHEWGQSKKSPDMHHQRYHHYFEKLLKKGKKLLKK